MSEQLNAEHDYVITQGEPGDCFYIITDGSAEAVIEKESGRKGEVVEEQLKVFGQHDFFGERALLRSEPRFASIRALSELRTVTITQAVFEQAMGKPLSELLPDYY